MYGERFWLAVGSGEALNESITGTRWPEKAARNARLRECVDIMRALWAGETVDHQGLVSVKSAKLYVTPTSPPPVFAACITSDSARWAGSWADGLITVGGDPEQMRSILRAFREGGGVGKPAYLQRVVSWATTDKAALEIAWQQWRQAALDSHALADLDSPAAFDAATASVDPDQVRVKVRSSSSIQQHVDWLAHDVELGFDRIYLHCVHPDQSQFIAIFGERILPAFTT